MGDIINSFFDAMGWVLAFFYGLVPNYAVAIALLTLTVMLVTTPVTLKGTKSMLQMQALQPEMKRIQTKYKDDREVMNQELMKFYQENGINPLGGCLPLLVQAPIFLVLFRLVQGLTRTADDGTFDPDHLPVDSQMFEDLSGSTEMSSFGIDLSRSASSVLGDGVTTFLPYLLLIAIVAVTSFYQQYQIRSRNPNAAQAPGAAVMKFLPLITVVFSWSFAAALVIYFVTSNLYRVGQQAYITKSLYGHDESAGRKAQQAAAEARKQKQQDTKTEVADPEAKNYTAAKGRPTPSRDEAQEQSKKAKSSSNRSKKKKKRR